jgi:hypothetical protein
MIALADLGKEELTIWLALLKMLHELLERRIADGVNCESSNDQI